MIVSNAGTLIQSDERQISTEQTDFTISSLTLTRRDQLLSGRRQLIVQVGIDNRKVPCKEDADRVDVIRVVVDLRTNRVIGMEHL